MSSWRPDKTTALALVGIAVAVGGAFLVGFSLTPPMQVCNSGAVTIDIPSGQYGVASLCGPSSITPDYTYGVSAAANASVDFYLIEGRQFFNATVSAHPCCNVSYAQAFVFDNPQDIGHQVRLTPSPVNFTYTPRTNTTVVLVILNTSPQAVKTSLNSGLFFQPIPVGWYFLAGLVVTPIGIILIIPHLFARRRREVLHSQEEIGLSHRETRGAVERAINLLRNDVDPPRSADVRKQEE